ncbi:XRE family transcriptional regulator, partial [Ruminococcus sp. AM58-7XD]
IGVNLLVRVGMVKSSYDTLLQEGEYTKEEKLFKKKTDTFSGVYWCLTTAIYLAWSFWTMSWDITWIVWPVAGVLFAALLGVVKMVLKNSSETQHYI